MVVAKGGPKCKTADAVAPAKQSQPNGTGLKLGQNGYLAFGPGHPGMAISRGLAGMYYPRQTIDWLAGMTAAQLGKPVNNATGLTGRYEIALYWAGERLAESSPDAGPTLLQALRDQFGLRVESKTGPVEFVVVDHAERAPADN